MSRTVLLLFCGVTALSSSGCVFPYLAYPKVSYTPNVKLGSLGRDVRAYRVDLCDAQADVSCSKSETLTEIPVTNSDEIPAQLKPSFTYRLAVVGIALNYVMRSSSSISLRLYRPGYELTEIRSWGRSNRIAWIPATDVAVQAAALDALMPASRVEAGSKSCTHREALLYGASEYERLAAAAESIEQAEKLSAQAKALRQRAEE